MATRGRRTWLLRIGMALAVLTSGGCYPKRIGPVGPAGDRLTWPEMNKEQKKEHMPKEVLPRAAALFGAWRPERFSQVSCTLCHGPGAIDGTYHMPSAHLPRLSGDALLRPEFEKYPDTTRLKRNRLVPMVSQALGMKTFSIITHRGFGCYSCHLGPDWPRFGH